MPKVIAPTLRKMLPFRKIYGSYSEGRNKCLKFPLCFLKISMGNFDTLFLKVFLKRAK
jgi:hypothetical protein